ncbi:MAG: hypothetical protein DIU80_010180 [Chloroflexota bacterium]
MLRLKLPAMARTPYAADMISLAALLCCALLFGWLGYAAPRASDLPMNTPSAVLPARSFNDPERLPDQRWFRWTNGQSRLSPPNPGGAVRLRLRLLDGPDGNTPLTVGTPGGALDFQVQPGIRRYDLLLAPSACPPLIRRCSIPRRGTRGLLGAGASSGRRKLPHRR